MERFGRRLLLSVVLGTIRKKNKMVFVKFCGWTSQNGRLQKQEEPGRGGGRPWAGRVVWGPGEGQSQGGFQVPLTDGNNGGVQGLMVLHPSSVLCAGGELFFNSVF